MTDGRWIRLRYAGSCRACDRSLGKGARALYDSVARAVTCETCAAPADGATPAIARSAAGASARREHDRRRHAREQRARKRWDTIGMGAVGAGLARLNTPAHEQAWATGARGEERVAARWEKLLKDTAVVLLHDRAIPGSRANIDHIAIGPGGVTVIDAKNYRGKVRTESRGGLLRPRTHHLLIGGRDKTALIEGVQRQVHVVAAAIAAADESLDVRGALCMVNTDALPLLERLSVDGIAIDGPKRIAKLAARTGPLPTADVERIAATLANALPPA